MGLTGQESVPEVTDTRTLKARFGDVRRQTMQLVAPLSSEDAMLQSMPDASPAKWHLAHTTWFFETFVLREFDLNYRSPDDRFHGLFNSYYKQLGDHPQRGARGLFSRPTVEQVFAYRQHVDQAVEQLLAASGADPDILQRVELGLHHEQQHQELILTDIKHAFWSQPLQPTYGAATVRHAPAPGHRAEWIRFPGGIISVGHEGEGFAFDNELPRHEVLIRPFVLRSRLVTNAEYLEFIADGGYARPELWLSQGWDTVLRERWSAPLYWRREGREWIVFTLAGDRRLCADEPVCHVSYYEADAYARWRGARLALEAEWETAAAAVPVIGNFIESGRLHPEPANPGHGLQQMFGDVWQWTSSPYVAYPRYRAKEGALGEYNGKFMCDQWVLRGGSCATPRSHMRASYRNFFPAQARWQFSGIRLAQDAE